MTKKASKYIALASMFVAVWIQAPHNTLATPCSCWDSGTSAYMGAKCHAVWDDIDDALDPCRQNTDCINAVVSTGLSEILTSVFVMERCHLLCALTQQQGVSGYKGNEWWYADTTAHDSCLKQNPDVLKNWKWPSSQKKHKNKK